MEIDQLVLFHQFFSFTTCICIVFTYFKRIW